MPPKKYRTRATWSGAHTTVASPTPQRSRRGSDREAFSAVMRAVGSTASSTSAPRPRVEHLLRLARAAARRPAGEDDDAGFPPLRELRRHVQEPQAARAQPALPAVTRYDDAPRGRLAQRASSRVKRRDKRPPRKMRSIFRG